MQNENKHQTTRPCDTRCLVNLQPVREEEHAKIQCVIYDTACVTEDTMRFE